MLDRFVISIKLFQKEQMKDNNFPNYSYSVVKIHMQYFL